jgi:electron transport complex protein RnfG
MKMIFNFRCRLPLVAAVWLLLVSGAPQSARAQSTFFTPRALLAEFFPRSQLVTYKKFELTAEQKMRIRQRLGYPLAKSAYTFYIAKSGDSIDGYAILDEEMGQHLPITYGVKFSPRGAVERQEILVYRERYGDEVRDPRFRQQFIGKTAADPLRPGEEVVAVSGATISSRAMAIGVRRCLVLIDELVLRALPTPTTMTLSSPQLTATR